MKHRFILISRWHLSCGVADAWSRIAKPRDWPRWWPQARQVCVEGVACDTPHVGGTALIEWKTRLGYGLKLRVTTTHVLPPFELEGTAEGDLIGRGLWLLEPQAAPAGGGVMVTYRWDVRLTRAWMRWCAPLLRPLFAWNHFDVMRAGAMGLARDLGCRLLRHQDFSFAPGTAGSNICRQPTTP